jgi:hypothetical protein
MKSRRSTASYKYLGYTKTVYLSNPGERFKNSLYNWM